MPEDVTTAVEAYGDWLKHSPVPKLLLSATPSALLVGRALEFARTLPNQREIAVEGIHHMQEDSPDAIGEASRDLVPSVAS